jgi:hypothetical protein
MYNRKMPILKGLDRYEYNECLKLYEYFNTLNYFFEVPFPIANENIYGLQRDESLKFYRDMKDAYDVYRYIFGDNPSDIRNLIFEGRGKML